MANTTEIKIGQGLGDIKFGISREKLKEILGEPEETEAFSLGEDGFDTTESWHYDEFEFSASFDEEFDWKLVRIAISAPEAELNGEKIIGLTKDELLKKLEALDFCDLDFEDLSSADSTNQELVAADEYGMTFWLDNGVVSEIQWEPLFVDEDTIRWPI
ncbi:MAG: hypothetical protein EOP53_14770 [Sphingobacteriales bacterium]|nr:MAG: hypothetical protein EOP53_14770 [Sphingobacteriales bacterium]